jgi:hypothetical protein
MGSGKKLGNQSTKARDRHVPVLDNWWSGTRTVIGYQSIREDNAITDGIK